MDYFVTGITGFIGTQFLDHLSRREGTIYALVLAGTEDSIDELNYRYRLPQGKIVPIIGDLTQPLCGVQQEVIDEISGKVEGFYHLGAIYSLTADAESQHQANVSGTREAMRLAEAINAGCFHHISSIVAAGFYDGVFTEEMFEEAKDVEKNPYVETKHISEGLVRSECGIPWRIYRPAVVVGNSETGWINKVDGPYYFFHIIDKIAGVVPRWTPLPMYHGNDLNLVPVDYVARAIDHISHQPGLDQKCFHLADPDPLSLGETLNEFMKAAKGPIMSLDVPLERTMDFLPAGARSFSDNPKVVERFLAQLVENLNVPKEALLMERMTTSYDCKNTLAALEGSGITLPPLSSYAARIWHYWEQHLHPDNDRPLNLKEAVAGKVVLVTGGAQGIGKQVGVTCAAAGATVILIDRAQDELDGAVEEIRAAGGDVHGYICDLTNLNDCDNLIDKVLSDHGQVDVLVNNAGRSIRRSLSLTYDRFHDFERVMHLNYFSALRLTMRLLPSMAERCQGQVVNISSIAALTKGQARFSAYMASKCALDSWSNSAAVEYADKNIKFTNIHMPLVRTGMISATTSYRNVPTLTPEEAAGLVSDAIINKPTEVNTVTGELVRMFGLVAPDLYRLLFSTLYQMTDDSAAAKAAAVSRTAVTSDPSATDRAIDAMQALNLDDETLQSISKILDGIYT